MRRTWRVMVEPDSSFQAHTFSVNFSRPRSWRDTPWPSSWRSTTICVAMPAWSVPGTHSVLAPSMRAWRASPSMMVWLKAWPMCSVPVTFGGGSWIAKSGRAGSKVGLAMPRLSHSGAHFASMAAGSKLLASDWSWAVMLGCRGWRLDASQGCSGVRRPAPGGLAPVKPQIIRGRAGRCLFCGQRARAGKAGRCRRAPACRAVFASRM
ncbi:hypothetical protein FQZ97_962280 [compost metagenome]